MPKSRRARTAPPEPQGVPLRVGPRGHRGRRHRQSGRQRRRSSRGAPGNLGLQSPRYVSTYRQLLMTRTAGTRPRQLALNGGKGLTPISIEKPFAALFRGRRGSRDSNLRNGELYQPKSDHRSVGCAAPVSPSLRRDRPDRRLCESRVRRTWRAWWYSPTALGLARS